MRQAVQAAERDVRSGFDGAEEVAVGAEALECLEARDQLREGSDARGEVAAGERLLPSQLFLPLETNMAAMGYGVCGGLRIRAR